MLCRAVSCCAVRRASYVVARLSVFFDLFGLSGVEQSGYHHLEKVTCVRRYVPHN